MKLILAVFGNPILHSKSPQLFNCALGEQHIDAFYTRIRPQSVTDIISIIKNLPLTGANITAPYKEDIVGLLDSVSDDAKSIGAVNTIVNINGKLYGYNTDHIGVTNSLTESGVNLKNANCLVLGAGGAAKAAVYGLQKLNANVYLCNRTFSKGESIAKEFGCKQLDWYNFDTNIKFDVIISTLLPQAMPPFLHLINYNYLLDASYKPSAVKQVARMEGKTIIGGERWLLYQAVEAFRLILNLEPSIEAMAKGFNMLLNRADLRTMEYKPALTESVANQKIDLIISTGELNSPDFKTILDEEVSKTFGG
jgi:shikimate dehydrogenase